MKGHLHSEYVLKLQTREKKLVLHNTKELIKNDCL